MSGESSEANIVKGPRFGIRHVQILLMFLNIASIYLCRTSISVIVVAMMNAETTNPNFPEFDWSEKERNYIISSFYWGYIITQLPASYLNRHFGAKIVMFCSTFSTAILTLLTPYLVTIGSWQAYCAIRVVEGIVQGALFPCINDHIAKWSPHQERYVLGALAYSGTYCGTVSSMLFSGLIASSPLGWPGISYIFGGVCLVWCVLWLIFGAKNAPSSRYITKEECQYIETSLQRKDDFHKKKIPVPWLAMLTSVPFIAINCGNCAESWSFSTLQNQIPSYLNGVFNMDIKSNALYSTLPYIARWIMIYIYIFVGKMAVEKNWLTVTHMRKTTNSIGAGITTIVMIVVGFLGVANMELVIALLVVSVGIEAGTAIGAQLALIDVAPNHASVVTGISNTFWCLIPLATPLVVGSIVTDVHDRSEWQIVFGISAAVGFVGNLVFVLFGTSEPAPWDAPDFLHKHKVEAPIKNAEEITKLERHEFEKLKVMDAKRVI